MDISNIIDSIVSFGDKVFEKDWAVYALILLGLFLLYVIFTQLPRWFT